MQTRQQSSGKARRHEPKVRHPAWIFWAITGLVTILTAGLITAIVWLVRTQSLNQLYTIVGVLASIVTVVFIVPSVLLAFFQWYFPRSPSNPNSSTYSQHTPPQIEATNFSATPPSSESSPTVWNVPSRRNPFFTGREQLLALLSEQFISTKSTAVTHAQALNGLGGIGKTQTAVEYTYRYQREYQFVFWVKAATQSTLIADFVTLAKLLHLPVTEEQDQGVVVAAVRRWLALHTGWLLILDNADDLAMVSQFLPTGGTGHILLTTRAQATGGLANSIEVEKMDQQEGTLFLLRRAKAIAIGATLDQASESDRTEADAIVMEMDGLPLALDQAGAYIEETGYSVSAYLDQYRQRQATLLNRRGGLNIDHPEPVATTWSLSFELIEQVSPTAADLLRFCAFISPDAIPEEMIVKSATELGEHLMPIATNPFLLDDAIGTLRRFSLVRRNSEDKTFSLHRLIQVVLKASMDQQTQQQWAERTVRAINKIFRELSVANWSQSQRYVLYISACIDLINQNALAFPKAPQLLDPPRWFRRGYRTIRSEARLIIHEDDPKHQTFIKIAEIEAFLPGITIYQDTHKWSGKGREGEPKILSEGHALAEVRRKGNWKYVQVHLGHGLNKGERAEIKTIQEFYDLQKKFKPFLSRVVKEPVDLSILHVVLPKNHLPSEVIFNEWNMLGPLGTGTLIRTLAGEINSESGEILWEIRTPIFGHRYEIEWFK